MIIHVIVCDVTSDSMPRGRRQYVRQETLSSGDAFILIQTPSRYPKLFARKEIYPRSIMNPSFAIVVWPKFSCTNRSNRLGKGVATVHDQVQPGRVRGSIGGQVKEGALELTDLTLATRLQVNTQAIPVAELCSLNLPHDSLAPPLILHSRGRKVGDLGLDVSRRHSVHAGKSCPLDGQALAYYEWIMCQPPDTTTKQEKGGAWLTEMDDSSLGTVVHGLKLRDVDDASAHRGGSNEAAGDEVLQRLTVDRGALLLLATEVSASRLGAPHDTVNVDGHDLLRSLDRAVDEGAVLPGDARVGDEDVETTVELGDDAVDGGLDSFGGGDIDLVRLACTMDTSYVSH